MFKEFSLFLRAVISKSYVVRPLTILPEACGRTKQNEFQNTPKEINFHPATEGKVKVSSEGALRGLKT